MKNLRLTARMQYFRVDSFVYWLMTGSEQNRSNASAVFVIRHKKTWNKSRLLVVNGGSV